MSRSSLALAALSCAITVPMAAVAEVPDRLLFTPTSEAFGAPPTIVDPMLSPDGTDLFFLQQNPQGVTMLKSLNLADASVTTLLQGSEAGYDILWCAFANETRILCDMRQGIPFRTQEYQKFIALNEDGSDVRQMRNGTGCQDFDLLRDRPTIDWEPEDPETIVFFCNRGASRLDLYSGRVTDVSGAGQVGNGQRLHSNGHGLGNVYSANVENAERWLYRETVDDVWKLFHEVRPLDFEQPFRPVGYGTDLDQVFNIALDPESGAWGLFRKELREGSENRLVFAHGAIDVELVDTMGPYNRVVSAAFLQGRSQRAIVDRRVAEVYQFLAELLQGVDIQIVDESWDQKIYLALARPPGRTGEYIVVNMETEAVQAIGPQYDHLNGYELTESRLIQFEGSDGGYITGQLTLPHDAAGPVPTVIMPRPRTSHEDVADPHYLVEFLSASGYAVLRVDNRVEEQFGRSWLPLRAAIGWEQTANDVNDAAEFLIDNGFSTRGQVCAVGKDYGAYASFMTAIKFPDAFQCIVSIAGITDPRLTPGARVIGSTISGVSEDFLDVASPIKRAQEINPPVLMFHGENDPDVSMANHTVTFFNSMSSAGKDIQFIEYTYDNHEIRRGLYRIDMLARMGDFLVKHIGPPPVNPGAPAAID